MIRTCSASERIAAEAAERSRTAAAYVVYKDGEPVAVTNARGPKSEGVEYRNVSRLEATRAIRGGVELAKGSGERLAIKLQRMGILR